MTDNLPRSSVGDDVVAQAAREISAEVYLGPDGAAVEPVIPPHATQRYLRVLDLRPGMRVLEIGTGSGYSAALMSHVVGPTGHVLTIDSDEALSRRAGDLFAQHGHRAIAAVGNVLAGHAGRAPYDRIYVGATPAAIPAAWLDQLAPDGALVTGCFVSDLPGTYAVAHIVKKAGEPRVTVHAGRYVLMGAPAVPPTVTVVSAKDDNRYYLATTNPDRAAAAQFLRVLRAAHAEPWPGTAGEFLDLRNWLLARRPAGLFTAKTELGEGIGVAFKAATSAGDAARYDGAPEVVMVTPAHYIARPTGAPTALRLVELMSDWRNEGYPVTEELEAVLLRDGDVLRVRFDD